MISSADFTIKEGEFQFDKLRQYSNPSDVQFGFASEDCTSVIRKIKYDVSTNSFIGWSTPLSNGVPIPQYYQTDSFEELKKWFSKIKKAPLVNIHMFQPLPSIHTTSPSPLLMSAYGVDNTFTANGDGYLFLKAVFRSQSEL